MRLYSETIAVCFYQSCTWLVNEAVTAKKNIAIRINDLFMDNFL